VEGRDLPDQCQTASYAPAMGRYRKKHHTAIVIFVRMS